MKYALLVYETAADFARHRDPAQAPASIGAYMAYAQTLVEAGLMRGGEGLQDPATATTVRLRDGKRHVQDGPFADTREMLGGFFLIDAPDLETALAWAARCPGAATGAIEVRPILEVPAPA